MNIFEHLKKKERFRAKLVIYILSQNLETVKEYELIKTGANSAITLDNKTHVHIPKKTKVY